ncbi:MACPF domain-containing protein NSL1 isoform X2 [Macadamia integrifolia]|uniref:MACPF domain-containing protein NSL1 isoform X2 n=1 Tax=Macadamia integrifolia TaxID=60698 RepID=UPI001C4FE3A9|nr:MACPF domain-containing protein NSL1 isoform X2 [Macadamia integrifolia]
MAIDANRLTPQSAAEKAVSVIGLGYDLSSDIRLAYCKSGSSNSRLIELDETLARDLVFPCGIVVPNVPNSIKCDKGERTRFRSDVLSFHQMSEQFNHDLSLTGKIPSGLFNAMFNFKGCWPKEAAATKSLAFDGWFMTLYNIELARSPIVLNEHVKQEVPTSWDAAALAGFIEKYGTHVIVGVKMGGKDVLHVKQLENSNLQPTEVQKLLKESADKKFSEDVNGNFLLDSSELSRKLKEKTLVAWELNTAFANSIRSTTVSHLKKDDIVSIHVRRGGIDNGQSHNEWISTISQSPNVISMSFVPITSLLSGVRGSGFLSHAVNLYLRYKPPIEELHQFLEFQLPRKWAPIYSELPLGPQRKIRGSPALQFTFMGPRLYVNTVQVDSGNRPVTGIRLYLEGRKNDHLAIHLQHLEMLPKSIQLSDDYSHEPNEEPFDRAYIEPLKCKLFSHICTAPVQYNGACIDESASIVTKAWFEVKMIGVKKVLFLRLGFSMVASAKIRRSEWAGPITPSRKSGAFSMLISARFSTQQLTPEKPSKVLVNSAVHPGGPPIPTRTPKLSHYLDTKEIVRGPEDPPGYWVVTGAKLCVEGGKISLKVKYSLLTIMSDDDDSY